MKTITKMLSHTPELFREGWSEVTSGERNEIVFARLNKTYGAYEIRTNYDSTLLKAFSWAGLFIILLSSIMLFSRAIPLDRLKPPTYDTVTFKPFEKEKVYTEPNEIPKTEPRKNLNEFLKPELTNDTIAPEDTTDFQAMNNDRPAGNSNDTGKVSIEIPGGGKTDPFVENPETIFDGVFVTEVPEFPGGDLSMRLFLKKNTIYPQYTKEIGGKGTVNVGFIIDKEGNVTDVTLLNACKFPELNNEAVRVVKNMPKWVPGKMQGNPVKVRMNLPFRFDLKQ
jgi:protein TonB